MATVVGKKCGGIGPAPRSRQPARGGRRVRVRRHRRRRGTTCSPSRALDATWPLIRATNAYLEANEPWKAEPGPAVDAVMGDALEALRIVAILASPAIPDTAQAVWERIGLDRQVADQRLPAAAAWGGYPGGLAVTKGEPLFPAPHGLTRRHDRSDMTWCRQPLPPPRRTDPRRRRRRGARRPGGRRAHDDHGRLRPGDVARGDRGRGARTTASTRPSGSIRTTRRTASTRSSSCSTRRGRRGRRGRPRLLLRPLAPRRAADAFAAQIQLAHERSLPLVIHTRDAWDDTFDILRAEGTPTRTIFHCFTGGPDEARRCLDLGASCRSPASSRSRARRTSRRRPGSARSTGCWSRPTARTWHRSPIAANRTGRPGSPTSASLADLRGVGIDEIAEATSPNAAVLFGL